jgi:hypothetical protein
MKLMRSAGSQPGRLGLIVLAIVLFGIHAGWRNEALGTTAPESPDAITIDTIRKFGEVSQRPPVVFFHDRHTDALSARHRDCSLCHVKENGRLSLSFKETKNAPTPAALMDAYHDNCWGCHREMAAAKEKSGPLTCGECHRKGSQRVFARDPMEFDKSLHYRHVRAQEEQCERCHHEYDQSARKTFYAKGRESSCRYCHRKEDGKTGMGFKTAAHVSCVLCHLDRIGTQKTAGPVQCRGCHDQKVKKTVKTIDPVPRLKRNQPDFIVVKRFDPEPIRPGSEYRMKGVPFDHKGHEENQQTCRVCHHESLSACSSCHSLESSEKGNFINLQQSMHRQNAPMSCEGCHEESTHQKACSGCHVSMRRDRERKTDFCQSCHFKEIPADLPSMDSAGESGRVKADVRRRALEIPVFDSRKAPETVGIKSLEEKYSPVEFPHGRIIRALIEGIRQNRLANYFHNGTETFCQGCHHNGPVGEKPPECRSCHGKPFDENRPLTPGLLGAYHRQCMECHKEMGIKKPVSTDCTACHQEKRKTGKRG